MGRDSERTASHEGGWEENGMVPCPPDEYPKWPARSKADRLATPEVEKAQDLDYPTKTASGSNRSGESKGSV